MFCKVARLGRGSNSRPRDSVNFGCSLPMQNTAVRQLIPFKMQIRAAENSTKRMLTARWS